MNRGSEVVVADLSGHGQASMRPRFMNRGSQGVIVHARAFTLGFNEAPIHESGKSGPSPESFTARRLLQ